MQHNPVYLNQLGMVCSLGNDTQSVWQTLQQADAQPLMLSEQWTKRPVYVGEVRHGLPALEALPEAQRSRNNQLLLCAWQQVRESFETLSASVSPERIGIVLGSSTSGIAEACTTVENWHKYKVPASPTRYAIQEISAPAMTLADWTGAQGPAFVISTACSSGAKALASARRLIQQDVCDVVIAGGVDSLAAMTLNGFDALESMSDGLCNPFGRDRDGINIGEGAAIFVMSKTPAAISLAGCGETSDAHHISAPHPDGAGAIAAMAKALQDADVAASDIDYINLHGTATEQNDRMEAKAVFSVFGSEAPCSSTKRLTGHTLGAAGAIEAGLCWLALTEQTALPPHRWDGNGDTELQPIQLTNGSLQQCENVQQPPRLALSNSFAFGGNNISLIFERQHGH